MSMIQTQKYCRTCGQKRLFVKPGTNHILHLLLTVITLGCWIVIWILDGLCHALSRGRCTQCGGH